MHRGYRHIRFELFVRILLVVLLVIAFLPTGRAEAATGINQEINFQGRLLTAEGATVPDGFYNIEFKIYQDGDGQSAGNTTGSPAGTLLWTESHLNADGNGVTVKNGFLSVQLGSVNPFGSSIDWNQDTLWISMNVGDTNASCTPFSNCNPDGEMLPMKRLSSTPYALNSSQLGGITSDGFIQLAQGLQEDSSTTTSIQLNKTGAGNLIDLQDSGNSVLTLQDEGYFNLQNSTDSTTAYQFFDAAGTTPVLNIDTSNRRIAVNTDSAQGALHVVASSAGNSNIIFQRSTEDGDGTNLKLQKSRGTADTPAVVQVGDSIGSLSFEGHDGAQFDVGTQIESVVTGVSSGNLTSDLRILTSNSGTLSEKARIAADGSITFSALTSCNTIDTDASGVLTCGSDDGGVDTIGTFDSQSKSSDGAVISGNSLYLQSADDTYPGLVTTNAQTFAGDKTFNGVLAVNSGSLTSTVNLTIDANGSVDIQDSLTADDLTLDSGDLTFSSGVNRNISIAASATDTAGNDLTISAGAGGSGGSAVIGGDLVLQGGDAAGTGDANGGNILLSGGLGTGNGARGLVVIDTPTITTASIQSCSSNCTINQSNIDNNGSVIIEATSQEVVASLPDPTNATAGRIIYVTAANGSEDFTLEVNGGGTGNEVAMRQNTTATMIWNGNDWTAAGASSSTTLQAAYDNTLTSAGGAEIVLSEPGGNADGLTVRNNENNPIDGGILEIQTSIGTNLFSVNNRGIELAANGGAEFDNSFSTDWGSAGNSTITRTTTSGEYVTGQAGVEVTTTASTGDGVQNNLSGNPTVSTTYTASFTAKLESGSFSGLEVIYSRDGGTDEEACTTYSTQTIDTTDWTKITCTITTDGTSSTNPILIIRQSDATARTFWIDNLSFQRNDDSSEPSNVQVGGGLDGGSITLFTLDRSSSPPVSDGNEEYLGSMYYDTTTNRIQCYEGDGWGACGSPPNNIITLTPEYAGSVLNGSGIGTMTADFCSDESGVLQVNDTLCDTGEAVNYYEWTSPQATSQTYSIYLTYQLPNTFRAFLDNDTITVDARTTDTADANVDYEVFRSTGSAITECGSDTTITTTSSTWQTVAHNGNEADSCGFIGGDRVIFKLNMTARNNDSVYVSDINFTFANE